MEVKTIYARPLCEVIELQVESAILQASQITPSDSPIPNTTEADAPMWK